MARSTTNKERSRIGTLKKKVRMMEKNGLTTDWQHAEHKALSWAIDLINEYLTLEPLNAKEKKQFIRGCGSKKRYSERSASIKAKVLLKKHRNVDVDVYLCGFCRFFHIGKNQYKHKKD